MTINTIFKSLIASSIILLGCDSDMQLDTKEVQVDCKDNMLHPNCQEELTATESTPAAEADLPPVIKNFTLANEASDGFINQAEKSSVAAAFTYDPIAKVEVKFTSWLAKSVACDEQTSYGFDSLPAINKLPANDGNYYVCAHLVDTRTGRTSFGRTPLVTQDTVLPVIAAIEPLNVGASTTVTAVVTESSPTSHLWSQGSGPGQLLFGSNTSLSTTILAAADGQYKVKFEATDQAGNVGSINVDINWDTRIPSFTSLTAINGAKDLFINLAESKETKPLFELTAKDYETAKFTGPILSTTKITCSADLNYNFSTIPDANDVTKDGTFAICVALSNKIGMTTYGSSDLVTRDTVAPDATLTAEAPLADLIINAAEHLTETALVKATSLETDLDIEYAIVNAKFDCNTGTFTSSPLTNDKAFDKDNTYRICATIEDPAGNLTEIVSDNFVVDTKPPTFTVINLAGDVADEELSTGEKTTANKLVDVTASDYLTIGYGVVDVNTTCDGAITYQSAIPESKDPAITTDGSYRVCVKLADAAGNEAYGQSNLFTYVSDNVAPTPTLTSAQGLNTNATTLNITATFDEDVTGFTLSDVTVVGATAGNFNAVSGSVYTFDLTGASGAVTVDIGPGLALDGVGNFATAATQLAITVDTTAPTVSAVSSSKAYRSHRQCSKLVQS